MTGNEEMTITTTHRTFGLSTLLHFAGLPRIWLNRRNQRIALAELDDHLIADIGYTRSELTRECSKCFWRE